MVGPSAPCSDAVFSLRPQHTDQQRGRQAKAGRHPAPPPFPENDMICTWVVYRPSAPPLFCSLSCYRPPPIDRASTFDLTPRFSGRFIVHRPSFRPGTPIVMSYIRAMAQPCASIHCRIRVPGSAQDRCLPQTHRLAFARFPLWSKNQVGNSSEGVCCLKC